MATVPTPTEIRMRIDQDAMPVHARVARAAAMFEWARGVIRRDLLARDRSLSAERLKWETAMRLYGADATSRAMIQRMLDHVSG